PEAALAALTDGAILVDIRPLEQRIAEGEVPGAIIIGRNVLEWRLDPRSDAPLPPPAPPRAPIIVTCSAGYASTPAPAAAAPRRRCGGSACTRPPTSRAASRRGRRPACRAARDSRWVNRAALLPHDGLAAC